jgi:hypothetical protein
MHGVPADMKFVNDSRFPGTAERLITLPVEIRMRDDALRRVGSIIDLGQRQVLERRGGIIGECRKKVAAGDRHDGLCIRVDNELIGIEPVPFMWSEGPKEPKSIELAGLDSFQPYVPDIAGPVPAGVEENASSWHGILDVVKEVEADAGSVAAEDRKVDASASRGCSQGKRYTGADRLDFAEA